MEIKCCGLCKYYTHRICCSEYICGNETSENFKKSMLYADTCEQFVDEDDWKCLNGKTQKYINQKMENDY